MMALLHRMFGPTFEFAHGWYLFAAFAAIPALLFAHHAAGRVVFSSIDALPARGASWRTRLAWLPDALIAAAVLALGVALAGPRTGDTQSRVRSEGIAILMTVDTSGSMAALDLSEPRTEQTRLDAVKSVFHRFTLGRPDDAIGLVSFARYADTRAPLTLDHGNLLAALDALDITREPGEDGTAIGDGLALAVERLAQAKAKSRVIILLTDGVNNAGVESPLGAAEWAKQNGIKVYTIGAGTNGMAPIRVESPFGGTELVSTPVEIDEELLQKIAETTGGRYFRATDNKSLATIYGEIDKLERTQMSETRFTEYRELYGWCVGFGLGLAVLAFLLRGTILRRLP
ncbi:MAG TPA: VWA domain-containing protein [Kofleriaceae bacterium]|nr:VWA domain-containing protein [Kofleriaceae bacterium]